MRNYILQLCLAIVLGAICGVVYSSCRHAPAPTPTPTGTQNFGDCQKTKCPT